MDDKEMVMLFTGLALVGLASHADKMSAEDIANRALNLGVTTLANLKNKGFSWPGPANARNTPEHHATRDELNDALKTEPSPPPDNYPVD